jgi:hypothetical protein
VGEQPLPFPLDGPPSRPYRNILIPKFMRRYGLLLAPWWVVVISLVFAAGMWIYVQRVLVRYQVADAAAQGRPRGSLSDLYPRWLGARELLLHGRNPYSREVTREIQTGYYGRPIDPTRPNDPKDEQGFAYPLYVVFYIAPTIDLPFDVVQKFFFWFLLFLSAATIWIWLRFLRWRPPIWVQVCFIALTMGSLPQVQALKLQQMTIVVAALLAFSLAVLVSGHGIASGILLALATIKPQLVFPLLVWLAIWTTADPKRRYPWAISFLVTMGVLVGASEFYLPGWLPNFWRAVHEYHQYTGAEPIVYKLIPSPWSFFAETCTAFAMTLVAWRNRKWSADTAAFTSTTCCVLAVTPMIVPTVAVYNQLLLVPGLLLLARDGDVLRERSRSGRVLLLAVWVLLIWPWVSSTVLAGLSFLVAPRAIQGMWAIPGWTALTLPVAIAALMLVVAYRGSWSAPEVRIQA